VNGPRPRQHVCMHTRSDCPTSHKTYARGFSGLYYVPYVRFVALSFHLKDMYMARRSPSHGFRQLIKPTKNLSPSLKKRNPNRPLLPWQHCVVTAKPGGERGLKTISCRIWALPGPHSLCDTALGPIYGFSV
jgi:hypothetical protein